MNGAFLVKRPECIGLCPALKNEVCDIEVEYNPEVKVLKPALPTMTSLLPVKPFTKLLLRRNDFTAYTPRGPFLVAGIETVW